MQHASQASFGMAEPCALPPVDKWEILAALTKAAPGFGLSHRTLSVLKALMTFLPDQEISAERGSSVVFPSNRTLSDRLNGMPESTLRRHLAKLVEMGIVSRQDSPNRKRYARRIGSDRALAYGFDLSSLAVHAPPVKAAAAEAERTAQRIAVLRERLARLRQDLLTSPLPQALVPSKVMETARLTLRRRVDEETLIDLVTQLEQAAAQIPPAPPVENPLTSCASSAETSGSDSQNERHIQDSDRNTFDSEKPTAENASLQKPATDSCKETSLHEVLTSCTEFRQFCREPIRSWQDLLRGVSQLAPMMGIDPPVYSEAQRAMGDRSAATMVLCMLERISEIRSPGAYLRRLAQKARSGQFAIAPVLAALKARRKLSADNFHGHDPSGGAIPA